MQSLTSVSFQSYYFHHKHDTRAVFCTIMQLFMNISFQSCYFHHKNVSVFPFNFIIIYHLFFLTLDRIPWHFHQIMILYLVWFLPYFVFASVCLLDSHNLIFSRNLISVLRMCCSSSNASNSCLYFIMTLTYWMILHENNLFKQHRLKSFVGMIWTWVAYLKSF